jgi:DNA phosphorothioation-associated DGQHR protein 1
VFFPLTVPALYVHQGDLGPFYALNLPAEILLKICYSDVLSASFQEDTNSYKLEGTQRLVNEARLRQIREYINRTDASFPNAIILAANFSQETGLLEEDPEDGSPSLRWTATDPEGGLCTVTIPSAKKLAAVIDGQHRLFGFVGAKPEKLSMGLLCSVFLDLPKPFQAQLFATINSTQKRVDKSLTYELFGYNIEDETESLWTPDKLAVFLCRKLSTDPNSVLRGKITISPRRDRTLEKLNADADWQVSTAVVVEGIMRLFTSNPKKDTALMLTPSRKKRMELRELRRDSSPLREIYLSGQDAVIYTMVLNFATACEKQLWQRAGSDSFIKKTVGVQALFDILRRLAEEALSNKDISETYFSRQLAQAAEIDFSSPEFRNASGSGRSYIRREIEKAMGLTV